MALLALNTMRLFAFFPSVTVTASGVLLVIVLRVQFSCTLLVVVDIVVVTTSTVGALVEVGVEIVAREARTEVVLFLLFLVLDFGVGIVLLSI